MNNKIKTLIGLLVFAALITAAVLAYNALSGRVDLPDNLSPPANQSSPKAPAPSKNPSPSDNPSAAGETTPPGQAADDRTMAPDFTVVDAAGGEVKLSSLFGKPIVLNFWASWCPPCKGEMPEFNTVYQELGGDVAFVMVDLVDGQRETVAKGKKHVADQGFTFPVYFDTTGEAGNVYGIASIPTTLFIDKDGYIVTGAQGAIDEATLRKGIELIK